MIVVALSYFRFFNKKSFLNQEQEQSELSTLFSAKSVPDAFKAASAATEKFNLLNLFNWFWQTDFAPLRPRQPGAAWWLSWRRTVWQWPWWTGWTGGWGQSAWWAWCQCRSLPSPPRSCPCWPRWGRSPGPAGPPGLTACFYYLTSRWEELSSPWWGSRLSILRQSLLLTESRHSPDGVFSQSVPQWWYSVTHCTHLHSALTVGASSKARMW